MTDEEFDALWTSCEWREVIDKQRQQLKQLAEAVLEAHKFRGELVYPDCVVCPKVISNERHPCQCARCQLARKIVEVQGE